MSKQPEALRLAEWIEGDMTCQGDGEIAAELRRLHSLNAELLDALSGMYEAYCRAGSPLNREERHQDRLRMMAAIQAIAKAKEAQQ